MSEPEEKKQKSIIHTLAMIGLASLLGGGGVSGAAAYLAAPVKQERVDLSEYMTIKDAREEHRYLMPRELANTKSNAHQRQYEALNVSFGDRLGKIEKRQDQIFKLLLERLPERTR